MTELRDYQTDVVAAFERQIAAGRKHIILVAPTGSGKTVIGSEIISRARGQGQHVLVLAHRREIITQTHEKLAANGVRAGIIQAGFHPRPLARHSQRQDEIASGRSPRHRRMPPCASEDV